MKNLKTKMSYALYVVLVVFLFTSCSESEVNMTEKEHIEVEIENSGKVVYSYGWNTKVRVFEIDDCEYIAFDGGTENGKSIIHKQNCKFCIKRNK